MNFYRKYFEETVVAIASLTRFNYNAEITVKRIRDLYKIDSFNYSKINFYWRSLQSLEEIGVLKQINTKLPKIFRVVNYFKFYELFHDTYLGRLNNTAQIT
ncbi:MAG: hypothetical protein ACFFFB_05480 [Candidatus Heimdallarchaeota archaeon]